jgi:hypothetical protein
VPAFAVGSPCVRMCVVLHHRKLLEPLIDLRAGDLITVLGTFTYAYFTGGSSFIMNGGNMISLALAYMVNCVHV